MQLTLRDFFWLTIVIGLVIGILIEHADVRALHGMKEKAQWWEEAAREMGKKAAKEGEVPEFRELESFGLLEQEGNSFVWLQWNTMQIPVHRDHYSLTGHRDLDFFLLLALVIAPFSAVVGWLIRRRYPAQGKAYAKYSVRTYRWMAPSSLFMLLVISIGHYIARGPFTATITLALISILGYHYFNNRNLTLTELEQQIDTKYEQPMNLSELFKLKK